MNEIVTVKFNGVTAEIKPVQDGMYDLNDIWRVFKLPLSKQPNKWRCRERDKLAETANLVVRNMGQEGTTNRINRTLGTKKALFMYAAWCDYEFHDAVFSVFQLVTEGKLEEAAKKASEVEFIEPYEDQRVLRTPNVYVIKSLPSCD